MVDAFFTVKAIVDSRTFSAFQEFSNNVRPAAETRLRRFVGRRVGAPSRERRIAVGPWRYGCRSPLPWLRRADVSGAGAQPLPEMPLHRAVLRRRAADPQCDAAGCEQALVV